jgi:hypothetical protein
VGEQQRPDRLADGHHAGEVGATHLDLVVPDAREPVAQAVGRRQRLAPVHLVVRVHERLDERERARGGLGLVGEQRAQAVLSNRHPCFAG